MAKKPLDREDRLEQQYRRLGTRDPVCITCNESNPFCLELHHIAGRKHDDDLSIVCRNWHRKLTDQQHDHRPSEGDEAGSQLTRIGHYLLGLCDLLAMVVEKLREFGTWLVGVPDDSREACS